MSPYLHSSQGCKGRPACPPSVQPPRESEPIRRTKNKGSRPLHNNANHALGPNPRVRPTQPHSGAGPQTCRVGTPTDTCLQVFNSVLVAGVNGWTGRRRRSRRHCGVPPQNDAPAVTLGKRRRASQLGPLLLALLFFAPLTAQHEPLSGSARLQGLLERLNTLGSLLVLGAHPDDENTAVIAYFARGKHIRTAYLSATRGEGGQNLIGPEQGPLMGVIRTQELLAARRIDGGEQLFTRAIDFGYSKSSDEALARWGRQRLLSDLVRVIRRFRPDVIVTRFPHQGSGGHGQHTAVGHLSVEAFQAAGDPGRFPDQLKQGLQPWRAKRLYWNTYSFGRQREAAKARQDRLKIDAGQYDPLLGRSYAEVAGESRSMHRSQGMGTPRRKGAVPAFFAYIAGEPAESVLFDGINTTWGRVAGAEKVAHLLAQARNGYRPESPEVILPLLTKAYAALRELNDPWVEVKKREVLAAIQLAAGLWIDAAADRWDATPGSDLEVTLSALNRSRFPLAWARTQITGVAGHTEPGAEAKLGYNEVSSAKVSLRIPDFALYSQPEWLERPVQGDSYGIHDPTMIGRPEARPVLEATFYLKTEEGLELPFRIPVAYRWVDRALGERTRALQIVPPVAVSFAEKTMIFPDASPRAVSVRLENNAGEAVGKVKLDVPDGWTAKPASVEFVLKRHGQQRTANFSITPPATDSTGDVIARAELGGKAVSSGVRAIEYPHIPIQVVYPKARIRVARAEVKLLANKIGYVMGAGDNVPEALEQLGASVTLLSPDELASGNLAQFDAVVTGVRALNTRPDLLAAREQLLAYMEQGGTLVVQYNTVSRRGGGASGDVLAPYPMTPSRNRVSREDAAVTFRSPDHPLLNAPNRITQRDFEGWVQERGLYFMSEWDESYEPILQCNDPGEPPRLGGLLHAPYGQGVYIYTGFSWFRQLPAGVPGAYRIFANLLSAAKASRVLPAR